MVGVDGPGKVIMNSIYPSFVITSEKLAQNDSMEFNLVSERQYEVQSFVQIDAVSLPNPKF